MKKELTAYTCWVQDDEYSLDVTDGVHTVIVRLWPDCFEVDEDGQPDDYSDELAHYIEKHLKPSEIYSDCEEHEQISLYI